MVNRLTKIKVLLLLICTVLACCASNHMVYVQETSLGLNLSVGAEGTEKFSFGYDRDIFAIVPKKGEESGSEADDAMSVLAINNARVGGLSDMEVSEFIATGKPASKLAKNSGAVGDLRKKIYGQ